MRGWRRMDAKAEAQAATRQHAGRALHVYQDEDGTVTIHGRLAPEVGALLVKALDAAREALYLRRREQDPEPDMPTMEQQQADALALLAETTLHHGIDPGPSGERYQVVVHVDASGRAVSARRRDARSGRNVSAFGLRRLARRDAARCGRPGDRGRCTDPHDSAGVTARTGPPRPRLSLPGLPLLCRRHHRAVHEEGHQVERLPGGELRFRRPDGQLLPEVSHPAAVPGDPVWLLRTRHEEDGLNLHAKTAMPGWIGERLDVGYAIDVLHPRAR